MESSAFCIVDHLDAVLLSKTSLVLFIHKNGRYKSV